MEIRVAKIPVDANNLAGAHVSVNSEFFEIAAIRDRAVLVELVARPEGVDWFDTHELLFALREHDPSEIKIVRKATPEERRQFRVPLWVQGEEIPLCCGQPMFFVGQIDDDSLCTEAPAGSRLWWHDLASFYVFTCSQCLGVKAVGQQY